MRKNFNYLLILSFEEWQKMQIYTFMFPQIDGLRQDCSISIANALEILQSCTKPLKQFSTAMVNSGGEVQEINIKPMWGPGDLHESIVVNSLHA